MYLNKEKINNIEQSNTNKFAKHVFNDRKRQLRKKNMLKLL